MTTRHLLGTSSTVRHMFKGWEQLYSLESIMTTFEQWYPEVQDFADQRKIKFVVESNQTKNDCSSSRTGFECAIYAIGDDVVVEELLRAFPLKTMIRPITWRSVSYAYLFASSQLTLEERKIICPHAVLIDAEPHELVSRGDLVAGPYCIGLDRQSSGALQVYCRHVADAAAIKFVFG